MNQATHLLNELRQLPYQPAPDLAATQVLCSLKYPMASLALQKEVLHPNEKISSLDPDTRLTFALITRQALYTRTSLQC